MDLHLGPLRGVIPAQPAADWLAVLMRDPVDLFNVVPGMCGSAFEDQVLQLMLEGDLDVADVRRVALDTITTASGRPWWFSTRLIKTAAASWELVGGLLPSRGGDAAKLSLSAWLDVVLLICVENMDQSKTTMFMSQLELPPAEERAQLPARSMEMTADAFMALARG